MDDTIRKRFIFADADLLSAIEQGEESLKTYYSTWSMMQADFSRAIESGDLNEETIAVAHNAATRVAAITSCFMDMKSKQEVLTARFLSDLDHIIDNVQQLHLSEPQTCHPQHDHAELHVDKDESKPPFIASAYSFLLQNIHNPYPSSGVKQRIACSSDCSLSSVNAWFTSARRRMGWTALCRKYFHNCRADTVDAAYRALVKEDPKRQLHPAIIHAFMDVKVTAEGLYSSTFSRSSLANDLDLVVKDMTEEDRRYLECERQRKADDTRRNKEKEKEERRRQRALEREMRKIRPVTSYPSPAYSRTSSSSPIPSLQESLLDEHKDEEDEEGEKESEMSPPIVAGHKRRYLSLEPTEEKTVPMKRLRPSARDTELGCGHLLSPQSSPGSCTDSADNDALQSLLDSSNSSGVSPCVTTRPRKRRLSDADAHNSPKRPRTAAAGPRGHAVSDPLPRRSKHCEDVMDDWFNSNFVDFFNVPPPVDSSELDQSTLWEVELFSDYCIPPVTSNKTELQISSSPACTIPSQDAPNVEMNNLDDFFRSVGGCMSDFPVLSEDPKPSSPVVPRLILNPIPESTMLSSGLLHDWTQSVNLDASPNNTFADNCVTPLATDLPQRLPEIDLVLSQLPASWMTSDVEAEDARGLSSDQSKLVRLQALREECQRMEREIQNERVFT